MEAKAEMKASLSFQNYNVLIPRNLFVGFGASFICRMMSSYERISHLKHICNWLYQKRP